MNYTYYQSQPKPDPILRRSAAAGKRRIGSFSQQKTDRVFLHKTLEIAVGALLLISPMFWLFIAELVK